MEFKEGQLAKAIKLDSYMDYNGCVGVITTVTISVIRWKPLRGWDKKQPRLERTREFGISISIETAPSKLELL
jgi:hypothetical protein